MALKNKDNPISKPAPGTVPARLARIVEIGEHATKNFGVKDQVFFWYSLPTRLIDAPESDYHGKQHMLKTQAMTMSNNNKSTLVSKHIQPLNPRFNLSADKMDSLGTLLNAPAYLSIVHNEVVSDKGTNTYANIGSVMQAPEGVEIGDLDTTPFYFDWDNPDLDIWTKHMSDWLKETVQAAVNYRGSAVEDMVMRLEAMSGGSSSE